MKTIFTSAFAVLTVVSVFNVIASDSIADDETWNQWRGPNRDGVWPGPLPTSFETLELVWEKPLQVSYCGPVTDGNLVYTTETVDESFDRMTAFDLSTGEFKWVTRWDGAIKVPPYAMANGSWIKSTPALAASAIVTSCGPDSNVRWRTELPEAGNSSPIVFADKIFLTQPMENPKEQFELPA